MTDSVSSCCCFSYWNKLQKKRAEIETNGREISTRCQGEAFIFISSPFFIRRTSSLCHQKGPDQTRGISTSAMLRSWRFWHGVLNTHRCSPRPFFFIPYLTGKEGDSAPGLPQQWGSTKGTLGEEAPSTDMVLPEGKAMVCLHNTCIW